MTHDLLLIGHTLGRSWVISNHPLPALEQAEQEVTNGGTGNSVYLLLSVAIYWQSLSLNAHRAADTETLLKAHTNHPAVLRGDSIVC